WAVHPRDDAGQTVLHIATQQHDAFSIVMLLLRGGRVDTNALDSRGWSALSYAVRRGNCTTVRWLIESGADTGIQHDGVTPLNMAVAQGDEVIVRTFLEDTPHDRELCLSASTGRPNTVQLLLDHGADTNEEDYYGRTPLDRARNAGNVDVEQVLLKDRPF
ncbi:hypothetical protein AnigIFM63309_004557, partial [Aspergillus niger]